MEVVKIKSFPVIDGVDLYLTGGSVRDLILGIKPKDRDFVALTKLTFNQLVKAIKAAGAKVFLEKPEFLTIRCRFGKEVIDIALPRSENNYTDGRHPTDVKRVKTLKDDASRRDFTINSMYMDKHGNIIDFFGGTRDIEKGVIKTVGDPKKRFKEDYLRIIRAIRFSIKLGFYIDDRVRVEIMGNKKGLKKISIERIKDELNKCLLINARETNELICRYNIWDILDYHGLWFKLTNEKRKVI